jgi:hypothetical protein
VQSIINSGYLQNKTNPYYQYGYIYYFIFSIIVFVCAFILICCKSKQIKQQGWNILFCIIKNKQYMTIILIELMNIVLVPFDWTRAPSPVCF